MIRKKYPKGVDGKPTTKEQWDEYRVKLTHHDEWISRRKTELNRMIVYLSIAQPEKESWTLNEIEGTMIVEILRSDVMDAPNKPGYYTANND